MLTWRRSEERGHADHGWLDTRHSFSFADYHDPRHVRFRTLRVLNEDRVRAGAGFGTHAHQDMEILSFVVSGALAHRDSLGHGSTILPGEVQRMSAGTGVTHSEHEATGREPVHFYQVWIFPERKGLPPSYEQRAFDPAESRNRLRLAASRDGRDGSVTIHQDAEAWMASLDPGATVAHALRPGRAAWIQVVSGSVEVDGAPARAGDGVAVTDQASVAVSAAEASQILLFDLA